MDIKSAFAKVLRQRRLELGLSQEVLADKAGISMRSISLLECNKQQPTITTIAALAKALSLDSSALIMLAEIMLNS